MNSARLLNGVDHWSDAIGETYSQKWWDAHVSNNWYQWHLLALSLYRSGRLMDDDACRFLAGVAFHRADMADQEHKSALPRTVTRGAVNFTTVCLS